jgi:hypothetical protein
MSNLQLRPPAAMARAAVFCILLATCAAAGAADPGQVGERWVQYALSFPEELSPLVDATGANCTAGQRGTTWYLANSTGNPIPEPVERTCTIPLKKTLVVPIVFWICTPAPGETALSAIEECAEVNDQTNIKRLLIDGERRDDLIVRRSSDRVFPLPLPENDLLGAGPTIALAVYDGYFATIPALPRGEHIIRIQGGNTSQGFTTDVRYTINVVTAEKLP